MVPDMSEPKSSDDAIAAGPFSEWLTRFRRAQQTGEGIDVPCQGCDACCTSSYFIHVGPGETETLKVIPSMLLFPAPGLPKGHRLLGVDEKGHCPMFGREGCKVYEHRPRTCRIYDCRVFQAAGLFVDERPKVASMARRWRFEYPDERDETEHEAVQQAARFLILHSSDFPAGFVPARIPGQAVLAVKVYEPFVARVTDAHATDTRQQVAAVLDAYERFEAGRLARTTRSR